jgi:MFS transporter, AAHS family, 4-hydroxybenzoate transporter
MADTRLVNITDLIDERPMSRLQIGIVLVCGMVNLLDGMDSQSIGVAAPLIANALGLKMSSLGPVFSAALLGAAVGALGFGPIADRIGRRLMLALSAFLFGAFTLLTAQAGSYETLLAYRFLAGIGLGGATPCFITLTSEYTPRHLRATFVGMLWACYPLGGMMGGFLNAWILTHFGWHTIFFVGGVLPFFVGAAVLAVVPESVRFLMAREAPAARVRRIVARMFPDAAGPDVRFTAREEHIAGISVAHLFTEGRATRTLLIWTTQFLCFGALAVVVLWAPALLSMGGMSHAETSVIIGFMGLGGFIGNSLSGRLLDRVGIIGAAVPALALGAAATSGFGYFASSGVIASICGLLTNGLVGLGVTSTIVICSAIYPTAIRSTGVGWAMGLGRTGQVFAPLLTGATLAWGWNTAQMMALMAAAPLIGAVAMTMLFVHLRAGAAGAGWRPQTAPEG